MFLPEVTFAGVVEFFNAVLSIAVAALAFVFASRYIKKISKFALGISLVALLFAARELIGALTEFGVFEVKGLYETLESITLVVFLIAFYYGLGARIMEVDVE